MPVRLARRYWVDLVALSIALIVFIVPFIFIVVTAAKTQVTTGSITGHFGPQAEAAAIDWLHEIAVAHAFILYMGEDWVQDILAEAFADAAFRPMRAEAAA
jgi:hypothetical protein